MQSSLSREDQLLSKLQNYMAKQQKQPRDKRLSPMTPQDYSLNEQKDYISKKPFAYQRQRKQSFRKQERKQICSEVQNFPQKAYERAGKAQSKHNSVQKQNYQYELGTNSNLQTFSNWGNVEENRYANQGLLVNQKKINRPIIPNSQLRNYDLTPTKKQNEPQRVIQNQARFRQTNLNFNDKAVAANYSHNFKQCVRDNSRNPLIQLRVTNYQTKTADQIKIKPQSYNYESLRRKYLNKPVPNLIKEQNVAKNKSDFVDFSRQIAFSNSKNYYDQRPSLQIDSQNNHRNRHFSYNVNQISEQKKFDYKIGQQKQVTQKVYEQNKPQKKRCLEERKTFSCNKTDDKCAFTTQHAKIPLNIMRTPPRQTKQGKKTKRGQIGSILKCTNKSPIQQNQQKQNDQEAIHWQVKVTSQINKIKNQVKKELFEIKDDQKEQTIEKINRIKQINMRINEKIINILNCYKRG